MRRFTTFLLVVAAIGCGRQASKAPAAAAGTGAATATAADSGVAAPSAAPIKPVPAQLPDVLATVDTEKIERWELEGALKGLEARAGAPVPAERRDEIVRGMIDQIVSYHVLSREAQERKVGATEEDFTARMNQIKSGFPTPQAFEQALAAQGLTLDQLQRQTRMSMDIDKLLQAEVASKIKVEDAEVGAFYQQNLPQFSQGESVHASHILITVPQGADAKAKTTAKEKAQDVLKQLKGGGDFAAIAKAQSQDPGSAASGGDLGFFPKGQTDPNFEAAAFSLKDGALSDIVETQFGFHIIKAHEHRAARTAPLEEVSAQIRDYLSGQKRDAEIQTFIDQAKARRKVQILV